ncbi:MAG: phosphatase [Actinobacteria bacterium]|nr:phosphatase [Actinomycetota bacterium]
MKLTCDLHVHTVASGHAFSTVLEVARAAADKGVELVALTDHGPALPGGAHPYHFWNLRVIPEKLGGVRLLRGVEANIINEKGELDLAPDLLGSLDVVHVAFHNHCGYEGGDRKKNTDVLIRAIENPYVDFIAHPGSDYFPLHLEAVVDVAAEKGIPIELNNSSLLETTSRPGARERDLELAKLAAARGLTLLVTSDAHIATDVGNFFAAAELAREAGIPEELILNSSAERVLSYLAKRRESRE